MKRALIILNIKEMIFGEFHLTHKNQFPHYCLAIDPQNLCHSSLRHGAGKKLKHFGIKVPLFLAKAGAKCGDGKSFLADSAPKSLMQALIDLAKELPKTNNA